MQKTTEPALKREIGATSLALNAINLTIGAGIFVLPAIVAENLGPASFMAYIICGILVVLIMLCYAEVGSKVTTSGGSYAYVEKAFGPLAGFLINNLMWFGYSALSNAAVVNALADMLTNWFPVFSLNYVRVIFFITVFAILMLINIRGVKNGSRFAVTATLLKLTPLILLVLFGLSKISTENLIIKTWPGINSIGETALILFYISWYRNSAEYQWRNQESATKYTQRYFYGCCRCIADVYVYTICCPGRNGRSVRPV